MGERREPIDRDQLHADAEAARARAYAPYSSFPVGAALLTGDGEVVTAVNVENASYGLSMCAERAAAFRAIAEGHRDFVALAIAGSAARVPPCGACRQVLRELAGDELEVHFPWDGELTTRTLGELLPWAFALDARPA